MMICNINPIGFFYVVTHQHKILFVLIILIVKCG